MFNIGCTKLQKDEEFENSEVHEAPGTIGGNSLPLVDKCIERTVLIFMHFTSSSINQSRCSKQVCECREHEFFSIFDIICQKLSQFSYGVWA